MSRLHGIVPWVLAAGVLGCAPDPHSSAGFVLPAGDASRGLTVLVEMRCTACHRVRGHGELPAPTVEPPVPIVLGETWGHPWTDGELVTAIIHPSFRITSRYPAETVRAGNLSRMGEYADVMTVQDLVDVVSFLQALHQSEAPKPRVPAWRTSPLGG
ncbi:MAG: c-type cytochrome [Synechococcaceae cyanobacterium]|nr:c-type cytochrome [Synechococcaceae cyanobacterium]